MAGEGEKGRRNGERELGKLELGRERLGERGSASEEASEDERVLERVKKRFAGL